MIKKKVTHSNVFLFILLAFSFWQTLLIVLAPISSKILPVREKFMYSENQKSLNPVFFWNRANFNGIHYLKIANDGYGLNQQSLFPFYPNLVKFIAPLFAGKILISSLCISNFSFLISIFVFYKLIKLDFSENIAKKTILFLILFPTSFYFGMAYTEGVFFLLLIASFYSARKGNFLFSGILGGIASYTSLIGLFIFPALVFEWFEQTKMKNLSEKITKFLPTLLVFAGLMVYMRFLSVNFDDPLKFLHVQSFFGAERTLGKLTLIYQVFYRYLKMITTTKSDPLYFTVWLELISALGFMILLIIAFIKKLRMSYLVFSVFGYIIPTLTGTFSSLPRYVLVLFPCFICLGLIKNRILKISLVAIFFLLSLISVTFFYRGYWIS